MTSCADVLMIPQVVRTVCWGPRTMLGLVWSAAVSCITIIGEGMTALVWALSAVGGSLRAFAPVGKAAASASKEVKRISCVGVPLAEVDG